MNEKDKINAWQDKIIDNFTGPKGWNGERILMLDNIEKSVLSEIISNFKGFLIIMDAFLDFLMETFKITIVNKKVEWNKNGPLYFCIQLISFWRLRASYIIFGKGYYVEAVSLLRGIYENVLLVTSLKQGIIDIEEVFGKLKIEESKDLSREKIEKIIRDNINATNSKIKEYFFGQKSNISPDSKKLLKSFERSLHNSVHKSKVNFFHYYGDWASGKKGLPIFPHYNETLASMYVNMCIWTSWMLLKILPFFLTNKESFGVKWHNKFKVLDESFREMIENFPKSMGKAVIELVDKKFTIK